MNRAFSTQKALLCAVVLKENFCSEKLKLTKIQEYKTLFFIDKHFINLLTFQLRIAVKTVVSYPLCYVSWTIGLIIGQPFISRNISKNEEWLWRLGQFNALWRDKIKLNIREEFFVGGYCHFEGLILLWSLGAIEEHSNVSFLNGFNKVSPFLKHKRSGVEEERKKSGKNDATYHQIIIRWAWI